MKKQIENNSQDISRKDALKTNWGNLYHFIKTVLRFKVKSFWQFLAVIQIFFL